ncbi:MAG: thioesterase family protein [Xanthobacteraceae bacterium]|nr:thioesterase family protein [Xanthobacteraceae bacterium]
MKASLKPGLKHRLVFEVTDKQTVPALFADSKSFLSMPSVFATGFMVGLFEWCCTELLAQHLDEGEGSLGTQVNFSHDAATPPGMVVTVDCEITEVDGKRVKFTVAGHDGVDKIGGGTHERFVINRAKFDERVAAKAAKAAA